MASEKQRKFSVEDTAPVSNWKSFGAQVNSTERIHGSGLKLEVFRSPDKFYGEEPRLPSLTGSHWVPR